MVTEDEYNVYTTMECVTEDMYKLDSKFSSIEDGVLASLCHSARLARYWGELATLMKEVFIND